MTHVNYKGIHFRFSRNTDSVPRIIKKPETITLNDLPIKMEILTRCNTDPITGKMSSTYMQVEHLGFTTALVTWIKNGCRYADLTFEEFVDSLLNADEISQLDGMPVAQF